MEYTEFSLFTKPWKDMEARDLGKMVHSLGFGGIEFPLREGYQVDLNNMECGLLEMANELKKYEVRITSVAAALSEEVFRACDSADVRLIRVMANFSLEKGFWEGFKKAGDEIKAAVPLCEKYNVKIGVQHHYGTGIFNSMELKCFLDSVDSDYVGAVWDAAHSALSGEDPIQGLDIVWERLKLVNLKTAFYKRTEKEDSSEFSPCFTTGKHGNTSWEKIVKHLMNKGYKSGICLPAEYTEEEKVLDYIQKDIRYVQELFSKKHY